VDEAVRRWAWENAHSNGDVLKIGYFGSYARGDWGVGSDLDIIIVLKQSDQPAERRGAKWDATELPVPADLMIFTERELAGLGGKLGRVLQEETVWVYERAS
jgi:predicted nucleotidyltransferase